MRNSRLRYAGLGLLLLAALAQREALADGFKLCIDQASAGQALDRKIAAAVGRQAGAPSVIVPFDGGSDDDDDGLPAKTFRQLVNGRCDVLLGYPVDVDKPAVPEGVKPTQPYARTGFVLVTRKAAYTSLDALPDGSMVAVTYLTAPNLVFERRSGLVPQVFNTDTESLRALQKHEVDAAMIWRPFLERSLLKTPAHYTVSPLHERHATFNLVGLYAEKSEAVAARFNQAIAALEQSGEIDRLVKPYADAMPAEAPAATPAATSDRSQSRRSDPLARAGWTLWPVAAKKHAGRKPPPALYTADQATAGQALFATDCAICHGPNLEGRAGPALKGPTFASPAANFAVADIFQIVSQNMPASAPASLSHDDYTNIMAFLMRENGLPAGSTPLTYEAAAASKAKFIYRDTASAK
jgi:mono/diheme cytochrome c family protein